MESFDLKMYQELKREPDYGYIRGNSAEDHSLLSLLSICLTVSHEDS